MVKDGYYWTTHIEFGERQIIEILDGNVYVMGDDRTYKQEEFFGCKEVEEWTLIGRS